MMKWSHYSVILSRMTAWSQHSPCLQGGHKHTVLFSCPLTSWWQFSVSLWHMTTSFNALYFSAEWQPSCSSVFVCSVANLTRCSVVLRRVTTISLRSGLRCTLISLSKCSVFLHKVYTWSDFCVSLLCKELITVFCGSLPGILCSRAGYNLIIMICVLCRVITW
jgi:hypothetical protein